MNLLILGVIIALFVIDVVVFSFEKYEWSIGIMVVSIAAAYFFPSQLHTFINGHWTVILLEYVPIYIVLGLVTAVLKWMIHNIKYVGYIRKAKKTFDIRNPVGTEVILEQDRDEINERNRLYERQVAERERIIVRNRRGAINAAVGETAPVTSELEPAPIEPPAAPVYAPEISASRRRKAFVDFYKASHKNEYGEYRDEKPKVYEVDYLKPESVIDAITPRAKDNVGLITIWILQWPVVIASTIFQDLVVKIGKHAARLFDAMFSYVSRKLVANATKGL